MARSDRHPADQGRTPLEWPRVSVALLASLAGPEA